MFFSCMLQSEHPQKAVLPGMKEGICVYNGDRVLKRQMVVTVTEGYSSGNWIFKVAVPQRLCTNLPSANRGAFSLLLQEIVVSCRL